MDRNDPRWTEHLDIITAWGEASARNQTPPPTDEQLWAIAHWRQDLNLPEHIDAVLLAQLREAFNTGRESTHVDLAALAQTLRERGHAAAVEHTGGGVVVLYAGRRAPDRHGDPRWSAALGPGWYEDRDVRRPFADTADLHVGPDSDDTWAVPAPQHPTINELVRLVIAVIDEVKAQRVWFTRAVEAARDAFTAHYPDFTADDDAEAEFTRLLAGWLEDHWPGTRTVPAHIAAIAASGQRTGEDRDR